MGNRLPAYLRPISVQEVNRQRALESINRYQATIKMYWRKLNHTPFGSKNWKSRHELLAKYTDERNGAVRMAYELDLISREEYEIFRLNNVEMN